MRKVKISRQEDGSLFIEGKESYPELKGKKLVVLTRGRLSESPTQGEGNGWEIVEDEAILLTEEEFESVRKHLKTAHGAKGA